MEHIKWLYEVIDNAHAQQMNQDIIQAIEYVIEGAKAKLPMEKEQIELAYDEGSEYEYQYHINGDYRKEAPTYYNETYGGNK